MKLVILSLSVFLTGAAAFAEISCDPATIKKVYLPKYKDTAQWKVSELIPHARDLCAADQMIDALRKRVHASVTYVMKENSSHICADLAPEDPDATFGDKECMDAYVDRVNKHIDACKDLMQIGHNPHSVDINIDESNVEITCLKSSLLYLKWNENYLRTH